MASRVLVVMGVNGSWNAISNPPEVFDTGGGMWAILNQMIAPLGPTFGPPCLPGATILGNGKILVSGGGPNSGCSDGGTTTNAATVYDPVNNAWTNATSMNFDRDQHALITLKNGRGLAVGGCAGGCSGPSSHGQFVGSVGPSAEIYDPGTDSWTPTSNMSRVRASFPLAAPLPDGRAIVCGGGDGFSSIDMTCETYDPIGGSWTTATTPGNLQAVGQGFHQNNVAIIPPTGNIMIAHPNCNPGSCPGPYGKTEIYNVAAGTWTMTAPAPLVRNGTVVALNSGNVLLIGGKDTPIAGCTVSKYIDVYSPAGDSWAAAGQLTVPRAEAMATLLWDGRVLIAGGCSAVDGACNCTMLESSAEIYDPVSQTSKAIGNMNASRMVFWGFLLPQPTPVPTPPAG